MANPYMLLKIGVCVMFLVPGKFCVAQSEMVLFTQTGLATEDDFRWAQQPKMLNESQTHKAYEHLQLYSFPDTSKENSPFSLNPWSGLEYDFDLVESLIPGFQESTYSIGEGLRLSSGPSRHREAIFHEAACRHDGASLVGFRSIETLRYSQEKGLTKTVHRVFPMENAWSKTHEFDEFSMISAIGHCDCAPSNKPFRKKHIRFQADVVVDVPFKEPFIEQAPRNLIWNAEMAQEMAYINLVRDILGDVGRGKWTAVEYSVSAGIIPTKLEREEIPFTMKLYDEWGEVIGTKDTVFVTPRLGDEFGEALSREELREAMIDHYVVNRYDDYGEVVGTVDMESNIPVHSIAGMRFYETWIFLKGEPCPRKQVNRIVLLRGQWGMDGDYQGLAPLSFALVMH